MSDPGWSDPAPAVPAAGPALPAERYRIDGTLGRGGMGEVFRAWDHHLRREVAWKRVRTPHPDATARLLDEARVTASLDHPGIVPILDVGRTTSGDLFYTMRLVRGQTLGEAVDLPPPQRLRHLLDLAHAVAHAHGRGVVHGDLKPSNVMVGPDGETQVLDWGLAGPADRSGARGGTARYLPPEGPRPGFAADVYALGATIAAVLVGRAASDTETWAQIAEAIPEPALRAVARRALAPADRYPTARELAADLAAYVDGGLVRAHDYAWGERLVMTARRWRWPLRVAAGALAAGVVVAAVAAVRVVAERDRAVAAETVAEAARARADGVLGQSLARQALQAVIANNRPEAEVLAAHALALGDHPLARGARMAFAAQAAPGIVPVDVDCADRVDVSADGWWCAGPRQGLPGGPQTAVGAFDAAARGGDGLWIARPHDTIYVDGAGVEHAAGEGAGVLVADGARAARIEDLRVILTDTAGVRLEVEPCDDQAYRTGAWDADGLWIVCREQRAVHLGLDGARRATRMPGLPAELHAIAVAAGALYVGVGGEQVEKRDLATGARVAVYAPGVGRIRSVAADPRGRYLVVFGASPGAAIVDVASGAVALRLPAAWTAVAPARDGTLRVAGPRPIILDLDGLAPLTMREPVGLSHAAVSPGGRQVALALANGAATVWDVATGARLRTHALVAERVPKAVAYTPDGRALWAIVSGHALPFVFGADGLPGAPPRMPPGQICRRLLLLRDRSMCLSYAPVAPVVFGAEAPPAPAPWAWVDAGQTGFEHGVILDEAGTVARVGATTAPVTTIPGASRVDVTADGQVIAIGHEGGITLTDAAGATLRQIGPIPERIWDVALSPDGRWVAAGGLSGEVRVWRVSDGALRAVLAGVHTERVPTVIFEPDWLLTAGWDGRAHRWGLGPLRDDEPPAAAEARWAMSLAQLVAR